MRINMTASIALATTATYLALQKLFSNNVIVWAEGVKISCDNLDRVNEHPTRLIHFIGHLLGFAKKPNIMVTVQVSRDQKLGWVVNEVTVLCTIEGDVDVDGIKRAKAMDGIESCTIFSTWDGDLPMLYTCNDK